MSGMQRQDIECKAYPEFGFRAVRIHENTSNYRTTRYVIERLCHHAGGKTEVVLYTYLRDKMRKGHVLCRTCSSQASQGKRIETMSAKKTAAEELRLELVTGKRKPKVRKRDVRYLANWIRAMGVV